MRKLMAGAAIITSSFISTFANSALINQTDYFTLSGNAQIDFESLSGGSAPGSNYDGLIDLYGATFGERFDGQTLSYSGNSDVLSGSPSGSLSLVAGAANQNLNIFNYNSSNGNILTGLGRLGFPDFNAIGEGAVTILFDKDQSEFGFQSVGGNLGDAYFDFFSRDGSLLGSINPTSLGTDYFGFSRMGGIQDIAGISIYNLDPAGIGFDNIIFDVKGDDDPTATVPEPSSVALLGLGLLGLGISRRRSRKK